MWDMKQDHLRNHTLSIYHQIHMDRPAEPGPQGGRGESPAQHRYHRVKLSVSCQCSHMSNHQCMMAYAQGSSVGTTSTSVPECRQKTPDRFAVCTVERTEASNAHVASDRRTTSTTGPQQPQGPQGGGAEPHGQDHQNHRDHRGGGEGAESPTQHRCDRENRPQQPRSTRGRRGTHTMGRNLGSYIYIYIYIQPTSFSSKPHQECKVC